jgi:hypothetical protein
MRSIQALSWLGTLKLYMGAPMTMASAAKFLDAAFPGRLRVSARRHAVRPEYWRRPGWPRSGEVADGIGGQVAIGDFDARLGGLPGLDHFLAELTGGGVVAEDAGIDVQQFHAVST